MRNLKSFLVKELKAETRKSTEYFNDYRFERKFYNKSYNAIDLECIIKLNSANFNEIFHQRLNNNIYFDTSNLEFFRQNINGDSQRMKVRVRWYGEMFGMIKKPVLEIKIRNGQLNRKESYPINQFSIDKGFNSRTVISTIIESDIPERIKEKVRLLTPTLLNQYSRKYFGSFDGNFRATIDKEMRYYKINQYVNYFINCSSLNEFSILELKYQPEYDKLANNITQQFPFRLTKSSKYVEGITNIYNP